MPVRSSGDAAFYPYMNPGSPPFFLHEACSPVRPVLAGCWPVGPSGLPRVHCHDSLEVLWALRPIAIRIEGERMQPLAAGTVVVLAPMQPHVADEQDSPPSTRLAGCHVAIREDFLGLAPSSWRSGILAPDQADVVRPALAYILRARLACPDSDLSADLLGMVRGIVHALRDFGWASPGDSTPGFPLPPVKAALDLIAWRWSDPSLTIDELAAVAGLGVVRFRQVFRQNTGLPPSTFVDRIRIDHARVLMARKDLKSRALAEACGFGSQSAFFRCYKRVRGCPPSADELLVLPR